jgi:hypothetical protein
MAVSEGKLLIMAKVLLLTILFMVFTNARAQTPDDFGCPSAKLLRKCALKTHPPQQKVDEKMVQDGDQLLGVESVVVVFRADATVGQLKAIARAHHLEVAAALPGTAIISFHILDSVDLATYKSLVKKLAKEQGVDHVEENHYPLRWDHQTGA